MAEETIEHETGESEPVKTRQGATWSAQAGFSINELMAHFGWAELRTAEHYVQISGASAIRNE